MIMNLEIVKVGPLKTNCYILSINNDVLPFGNSKNESSCPYGSTLNFLFLLNLDKLDINYFE